MTTKIRAFVLSFSDGQEVFYSGQTVSGKCLLSIDAPLKARGVRLAIKGEAHVFWTKLKSRRKESSVGVDRGENYTEQYSSREVYFNLRTTLWGKGEKDRKGDNPVLPAGEHIMPFAFQLPSSGLPSSFEGEHGHIRYWLEATVDRPWTNDYKTKRAFTVHDVIDVNLDQMVVPIEANDERTLCCFCCKSGPLYVEARLDRCGYCPGEAIAISTCVRNFTNREMRGTRARIVQTAEYFAQGSRHKSMREVALTQGVPIQSGLTDEWHNRLMTVPAIPPTTLQCRIIRITYIVEISVVVPNGVDVTLELPITIGTVPFRRSHPPRTRGGGGGGHHHNHHHQQRRHGGGGGGDSQPPTYAEAMGNTVTIGEPNERYVIGDLRYTPLYAYVHDYHFHPSPPSASSSSSTSSSAQAGGGGSYQQARAPNERTRLIQDASGGGSGGGHTS
ncbi:arrestin domain-containing protein 3-like [Oscarella lobularis]|uniref:arrestin domain-containing protein 3-like n=1 Tax=Oscarella lobularis TaxID=121494 RepID=UPI003313C66A